MKISNAFGLPSAIIIASASLSMAACGGGHDNSANVPAASTTVSPSVATPDANAPVATAPMADTVAHGHHSKLAGAALGAAAGHMLGGHAVAGAAVGAIVQHERNKHRR